MSEMKITCIGHSGFWAELGDYNLIFDYYTDEKNIITPEIFADKKTCVFVSHNHHDHYNKKVFEWTEFGDVAYVLENDCPLGSNPATNTSALRIGEGEELSMFNGAVHVKAYGSTDEGVSFLVRLDGLTIFHAGDLNNWHWDGEMSKQELAEMESNYLKVLHQLAGINIDVAFLPDDPRLGVHARRGIEGFERIVGAKKIVPMHFPGNAGERY